MIKDRGRGREEQTLLIIKPDAVSRFLVGEVLKRVEENGFKIIGLKRVRLNKTMAKEFYGVHRGKPFYESLVKFMTSGPVVVACLEKRNAVKDLRKLTGVTDPQKAESETIRYQLGKNIQSNAVHASDSLTKAKQEIKFFFRRNELIH